MSLGLFDHVDRKQEITHVQCTEGLQVQGSRIMGKSIKTMNEIVKKDVLDFEVPENNGCKQS